MDHLNGRDILPFRLINTLKNTFHGILYTFELKIKVDINCIKKVIVVARAAPIAPFAFIKK